MKTHRFRLAALVGVALAALPAAASAQVRFEYAVKVVCGRTNTIAAPGTYATVVNVHAPRGANVQYKVATAGPLRGGVITPFQRNVLGADVALAITCREIEAWVRSSPVDGFAVIQSDQELDVVAVYTAEPPAGGVSSMHVERYTPRPINAQ